MKSLIILIPYFGSWPKWMEFFLASCRANPTIDWLLITDCADLPKRPGNVKLLRVDFADYWAFVARKLKLQAQTALPYKLCDVRPALGWLHQDEIRRYDYYGYGDLDVIYGNIREIFPYNLLEHRCISTHPDRLSGHLSVFKNDGLNRHSFRSISNWRDKMGRPEHIGLDEGDYTYVFLKRIWNARRAPFVRLPNPWGVRTFFEEQHTTILSRRRWWNGKTEHPQEWIWRPDRLTNTEDGERRFLYLHFMNWKSSRWLPERHGATAAWESLPDIDHCKGESIEAGFRIDRTGFHPLVKAPRLVPRSERTPDF